MSTHKRASRFALRNWRVPTRLTALILAPTLIAVILASMRVAGSVDSLSAYERTATAAEYAGRLRELAQQLAAERDHKAWLDGLIGVQSALRNADETIRQHQDTLSEQKLVVDSLIKKSAADLRAVDESFGPRVVEDARQVLNRLETVADSHAAERDDDPRTSVFFEYGGTLATVLRLHDDLGELSDDPGVVSASRALSALAHVKDEASQQRAIMVGELLEPRQSFTPDDLQRFLGSWSRQETYESAFNAEANTAQFQAFHAARISKASTDVEMAKAWAAALGSRNQPLKPIPGRVLTAQDWFRDNGTVLDAISKVEAQVATALRNRADDLRSTERRSALVAGALILALILLVLVTTVLIARSMVRPLRRLRAEALDIAGNRLPEIVRRMRESETGDTSPAVQPIAGDNQDEIGEVAQAFDEVHLQAVKLAGEESRLRNNVNAMFVNLSRRTQTLVERQISLIDGLERGEQDGARLADLFKLDHLATRMRRNSENLLVLAGHETARKRSSPARLVDVVRASLSEVEDYERVTVRVHRSPAIAGHAANDVVHLVAELVENAISFSPPSTKVIVSSSPIEGGAVLLAITDNGMGLSPDELLEINTRLAEPPVVDVSVSRRMGLFVVGRLAGRHGIRVQLRRGDSTGIIAMVLFPAELISNADAPAQPPQQPQMTRPRPELPTGPLPALSTGPFTPGSANTGPFAPGPANAGPVTTGPVATGSFGTGPHATGPVATGPGGLPQRKPPSPRTPADDSFAPPGGRVPRQGQPPGGTFPGFERRHPTNPAKPAGPANSTGPIGSPSSTGSTGLPNSTGQTGLPNSTGPIGSPNSTGRIGSSNSTGPIGSPNSTGPVNPANSTGPVARIGQPGPTGPGGPAGLGGSAGQTGRLRPPTGDTQPTPLAPPSPEHSGAFPVLGAPAAPAVGRPVADTPLERGDEFLPIFASVESSAWFTRPEPPAAPVAPGAPDAPVTPGASPWGRHADQGFQAARAANEPASGGVTQSGLPKRTPRANLVPGSVGTQPQGGTGTPPPESPRPQVSPEAVRDRLSSFQQGVRRGRAERTQEGTGNEEEGS
ncbi:nitrate- and nitrite sensing domain-containing protein [Herbidospora sp. NBRC 101105]|uniref:sensor histidine kinase n=1 Tax=Herbidospora sp. NBRC 101105 TaxID=3032195 RepID=UPI0025539CDE|nr:nitrate- and nitrite sensing domain-containing protein [Herbidospora sp. NBRC 101105]